MIIAPLILLEELIQSITVIIKHERPSKTSLIF
jgi:hypothetical protein